MMYSLKICLASIESMTPDMLSKDIFIDWYNMFSRLPRLVNSAYTAKKFIQNMESFSVSLAQFYEKYFNEIDDLARNTNCMLIEMQQDMRRLHDHLSTYERMPWAKRSTKNSLQFLKQFVIFFNLALQGETYMYEILMEEQSQTKYSCARMLMYSEMFFIIVFIFIK